MNHNHLCNGSTWGIHFVVYPSCFVRRICLQRSRLVTVVLSPFLVAIFFGFLLIADRTCLRAVACGMVRVMYIPLLPLRPEAQGKAIMD